MKRWSVLFLALALWALARGAAGPAAGRGGGGRSAFRFCGGLCTGCGGRSVRRQAGGSGPSPDGRGDPGGLFPGGGGVRLVQPGDAALRREDADHRRLALLSGGVPGHGKSGRPAGLSAGPVFRGAGGCAAGLRRSHPLYQDVDGTLYVLPTSRERDESKGQADIQIKPYGQAGYSVIVEVDLLADGGSTVTGVESYAFPYEFLEDRWVFTDFHLIY